jgi:hypothetical protein
VRQLRSEPIPARVEVLTATPDLERVQKLLSERYKLSYRVVMLSTGSGAVSAAGAASPTAPRWRSRSTTLSAPGLPGRKFPG